MIKMYARKLCTSSNKARNWFEKQKIDTEIANINGITRKDLIQILGNTDEGFDTILRSPKKLPERTVEKIDYLKELSFNKGILFLQQNPSLLKTPIIFEENKIVVGFNENQIRVFLSNSYRTCVKDFNYFPKSS